VIPVGHGGNHRSAAWHLIFANAQSWGSNEGQAFNCCAVERGPCGLFGSSGTSGPIGSAGPKGGRRTARTTWAARTCGTSRATGGAGTRGTSRTSGARRRTSRTTRASGRRRTRRTGGTTGSARPGRPTRRYEIPCRNWRHNSDVRRQRSAGVCGLLTRGSQWESMSRRSHDNRTVRQQVSPKRCPKSSVPTRRADVPDDAVASPLGFPHAPTSSLTRIGHARPKRPKLI
jgi:hypothetical protein